MVSEAATKMKPEMSKTLVLCLIYFISVLTPLLQDGVVKELDEFNVDHTSQTNSQFNGYSATILASPTHFLGDGGGICVTAPNATIACSSMREGFIDGTGYSGGGMVYDSFVEVDWVEGTEVEVFSSRGLHACYLDVDGKGYCWGSPQSSSDSASSLGSTSLGNNPSEITYVASSLSDVDAGNSSHLRDNNSRQLTCLWGLYYRLSCIW